MGSRRLAGRGITRRACVALLPLARLAAQPGKGRSFSSDARRFADPTTEFPVERLTDPAYTSLLPAYYGRPLSKRGTSLLFASDRAGSMQAFRMEIRSGETRQITDAQDFSPSTLTLLPDDQTFCFLAGRALMLSTVSSFREREVYGVPDDWEVGTGFSVSVDGVNGVLVERKGEMSRIQLVGFGRTAPTTVIEMRGIASDPAPRPKRASILYRRENELWLVHYDGQQNRRLPTAPGGVGPALWSPDGRTILYLSTPEDPRKLITLRELTPDTNQDQAVAPTSQFGHFQRNSDASVFIGASRSLASPYVLLLLRATKREFTLCEHRASDPNMVAPIFSPTSQRIYFVSDKNGKPAIYSQAVERLVERTETN